MRRKFYKTAPGDRMSREIRTYLPQSLYNLIRARAEKMKLPMSRLVAWAVDKEMDREDAFDYDCSDPETTFIEDAYTDEGGRIYRHLLKAGPLSADQIMLARRDMGLHDRMDVRLGYRELASKKTLVELVHPTWSKFRFDDEYRVLAVKTTEEEKKKKNIAKLEAELQKLKGGGYATAKSGPVGSESSGTEDSEE